MFGIIRLNNSLKIHFKCLRNSMTNVIAEA